MNKYQISWKQLQNKKFTITPLSSKFVKTLKELRKEQKAKICLII